jgi:chitinase
MKKTVYISSLVLLAGVMVCLCSFKKKKTRPVIIGYVGGYRGLIPVDSIDVWRLSHVNYAFVDIKDNRAWLHNEKTDTTNLRKLSGLKKINPSLKILISIGGWTWSKNFSDAVLTDSSTANFASSAVAIVEKYNLDGVDIDWEYPGMPGDSNTYRVEDKQHYTNLFKNLRRHLDSLSKITHTKYYITTAVGGSQDYIDHTEMDRVAQYTDYINVMSYDYADGTDSFTSHHTNLYPSSGDPRQYSADRSIHAFLSAGVPGDKIVIGIAFYGKGWETASNTNDGLYQRGQKPAHGGGFTFLKDSVIDKNGFRSHWDRVARAPYVFNPNSRIFISYDDERSVKEKCKYVKRHYLAGAMFWEYFADKKEYLLKVIAEKFNYKAR